MNKHGDMVFISHSSVDKKWAVLIKKELEGRGISAWIDQDEIRPGALIAEALGKAIESSACVIVIVSQESMKSRWVREEYHQSLNSVHHVIPVILDDADLPGFLRSRLCVDFRDASRFAEEFEKLVWGITNQKPNHENRKNHWPNQSELKTICNEAPVRVPDFETDDQVSERHFIDREIPLKQALQFIDEGRRFIVVGESRAGKTSFCDQVIRALGKRDEMILAARLDLEAIKGLTIDTLLGHTLIYMLGATARVLFKCAYSDFRSESIAHLPHELQLDANFHALRNLAERVENHFYGENSQPKPMDVPVKASAH